MPCPWTCAYFSLFIHHHFSLLPPCLCPWRATLLWRYLFDSYPFTITKSYDCYLRTYSSLFSYLWYDVSITYTLCLVLPMIRLFLSLTWPHDSSFLILSLTHPIHFASPRHIGLFTSSDLLTLISDLASWLVPLIVTHHGLWLILYGFAYIRSSTYPP